MTMASAATSGQFRFRELELAARALPSDAAFEEGVIAGSDRTPGDCGTSGSNERVLDGDEKPDGRRVDPMVGSALMFAPGGAGRLSRGGSDAAGTRRAAAWVESAMADRTACTTIPRLTVHRPDVCDAGS
jgi:hypothetical protein